jgi:protein-S-isoprenylcysteine O-methyltransferase Ste14
MRSRGAAAVGTLVFFWVAPAMVAGWVPHLLSGWRIRPPLLGLRAGRALGIVLIGGGLAMLLECFARFALQGRGTPAPIAPTEHLVSSGLYRYVRNPMYVAMLAIIVGQALLLGSAGLLEYAAAVGLAFHLFVVTYEEPTLGRRYGTSYALYRANVRRWWPRITGWRGSAEAPSANEEGR